tara:strand:+ start:1969 stop:3309 length:1341 start_codon:yes stop_codon:yes gene_type:complete
MKNILVIPNITYKKDLSKDSFVYVMKNTINYLNKIRQDLYFHIPLTSFSKQLDFDNVAQYPINLPSYPNSMRGHFVYEHWLKIIDWKNKDIDLIYSHLPEHTVQVINLIANVTNIGTPPIIGYCHWFEIKEITMYDKTYLLNNINGILEMQYCGVNTIYQKELVINNVKSIYSDKTITNLHNILKPTYLGIEDENVIDNINKKYDKIIVFNHRPQAYKDYPFFIELMDELYNQRQDFKVWIPLLDKANKKYIITNKYDKQGYYDKIKKCCFTFAPKQKYGGWSVSATDSMMNGCPVVFHNEGYYRELAKDSGVFASSKEDLLKIFNKMLDTEYRNEVAEKQLHFCKTNMLWEQRIKPINQEIDKALKLNKPVTDRSKRAKDILEFIKQNKNITKQKILKHLGWGVNIKFSGYRNFLLQNGVKCTIKEINGKGGQKTTLDIYNYEQK